MKHRAKEIWFEANGYPTYRTKLFVGDYTLATDQSVCIDTKRNILELAGNICGKQHERFRAECIRAHDTGIQLIVLIEQIPPLNDLANWTSKLSQVKGATLKKAMATMTDKYGVQFEFCKPDRTAKRIIDILFYGEY